MTQFQKRVGLESPVGTKSIGCQASLFCSLALHSWPLLNNEVRHRTYILPENLIWFYYSEDHFCLSMHASIFSHYIICPRWPMLQKSSFLKADHNESFTLSDKICCIDLSRHSFCYILNYILCYNWLLVRSLFMHRQLTCILHPIYRFTDNSSPAACQNAR